MFCPSEEDSGGQISTGLTDKPRRARSQRSRPTSWTFEGEEPGKAEGEGVAVGLGVGLGFVSSSIGVTVALPVPPLLSVGLTAT